MEGEEDPCASEEVGNDCEQVNEPRQRNKMSLSRCEVCGKEEAKYRCPRCRKYSCSLPCVKKHKMETTCTGVRDKTAFVSLEEFNELHLLSDYRFLEDMDRLADNIFRNDLMRFPTSNYYLFFLKGKARKHNISLLFLPIGFSKREENTTFFSNKCRRFFWHLKLSFPQANAQYSSKRVPDNKTLDEILKKYIDPVESDPVLRQRLQAYVQCQPGEVNIFMKAENRRCSSVRYHKLDISKSLLENLKNKVIIEYPTLHIVQKDHSEKYKVLSQDVAEDLISDAQMAEDKRQMKRRGEKRTFAPNSMNKTTRKEAQTDYFKGPPPIFQNNQNWCVSPSSNPGFPGTAPPPGPPPAFQNCQNWSRSPSWMPGPPATEPSSYFQNWSYPSSQTIGTPGTGPPPPFHYYQTQSSPPSQTEGPPGEVPPPTFHIYQNWSVPPPPITGTGPPQPFRNYQNWSVQPSQTTGTPGSPHSFPSYQNWPAPSHNIGSPGEKPPGPFQNNHDWSLTLKDKENPGTEHPGLFQNSHSWLSSPIEDKENSGTGPPAPFQNYPEQRAPPSEITETPGTGTESSEDYELKVKSTYGCSPPSDGSETEEGEIKDDSDN